MSTATFHVGDAFAEMAKIPDGSVDLIVTSPPFLALRSYLPADHPDKGKEIGSEATPAAFLTTLLALTREWRRVLAPHGSICVELGDTYAGDDRRNEEPVDVKTPHRANGRAGSTRRNTGRGWPLDKSLCLLPTLYPASLAYGRNLLAPDDVIDPWRIRNLIVWHRPNPPVGALGDKVRPSTSYVTVACTRRDRWFDLDAERTEYKFPNQVRAALSNFNAAEGADESYRRSTIGEFRAADSAGAPPLDYWQFDPDPAEHQAWTIPTQPYAGSHYATFPIALPRRLIRLTCPQHVCRTCGQPRRRITEKTEEYAAFRASRTLANIQPTEQQLKRNESYGVTTSLDNHDDAGCRGEKFVTLGWSDCGHDDYRRGIVLDPFAGSGTTLAAATEQGRDAIGIDLDADNYWLARERVGMFLTEAV